MELVNKIRLRGGGEMAKYGRKMAKICLSNQNLP